MSQAGRYGDDSPLPDLETLTGDVGGAVGPDAAFNVNLVGAGGVTVTGNPGTNTLSIAGGVFGLTWTRVAGAAQAMTADNGYINTNAGLTTFTLPAAAAVGSTLVVMGEGAGGWTISQNAGQNIQFGNLSTTVGVGGSIASSNQGDTLTFICRVASTTWSVQNNVGVLNVV